MRQGRPEVVVCQRGHGATNIGAFHESLNLAALWNLPVVFRSATPVANQPAFFTASIHRRPEAAGLTVE